MPPALDGFARRFPREKGTRMSLGLDGKTTDGFADPYQHYRKILLPIERVRALSTPRSWRVVCDTAWCWAWIVAAWAVVALWPVWWVVLLAIPVIGSRYYALYLIGHDGLHRRLFPDRAANDLYNDLLALGPIGAITRLNGKNHLSHHRHLATELDPDRHKHGCFNKSRRHELFGYLTGVTSVVRSVRHVFFSRPAETDAGDRYTLRDCAILAGWQAVLIGSLSVAIGWWAYPVLWLLPVYIFTFLADNFRSFAEHSQPRGDVTADQHRLITYRSNVVERLFLAPMNMNYHTVHHLWPSIPYFNLPEADHAIRQHPAARDLEWRGSYLGYLWRYYRALPLHECRQRLDRSVVPAENAMGGSP
jgi:fatty acid desaturase